MDNNKDVQLLKDKIQTRQVATEAKVIVIKRNQVGEETTLLDKIWKNQAKEQEV